MLYPDIRLNLASRIEAYIRNAYIKFGTKTKDNEQMFRPYSDAFFENQLIELTARLNSRDGQHAGYKMISVSNLSEITGYKIESPLGLPTFIFPKVLVNTKTISGPDDFNSAPIKNGFCFTYPYIYQINADGTIKRAEYNTNFKREEQDTFKLSDVNDPQEIKELFKTYNIKNNNITNFCKNPVSTFIRLFSTRPCR